MTQLGTIAWYSPARGFGFIAPDRGGPDIIVHEAHAPDRQPRLRAGSRVSYMTHVGMTEAEATNLVVLRPNTARHD